MSEISRIPQLVQPAVPVIEARVCRHHKQVQKIKGKNIVDISRGELAADAEDVSDHDGVLEHDALSLRGFRTDGFSQVHRP